MSVYRHQRKKTRRSVTTMRLDRMGFFKAIAGWNVRVSSHWCADLEVEKLRDHCQDTSTARTLQGVFIDIDSLKWLKV